MRTLIPVLLAALAAVTVSAERQPFERYQTIVDRQMFGELPVGFDPAKMPSEVAKTSSKAEQELSQAQEQVKKAIRFSVINVTAAGETVVGFTDSGDPKNPLHYYLKVGESRNGWTVKEADPDEATMTIVNKEGIEVTLQLGGDSASNAAAVTRAGAAPANAAGAGSSLLGGARSMRERRRQREEQIRAEESAKRAAEDKVRAEREEADKQQREAEREQQRQQLMQIQEELRKAREAREAQQQPATQEKPAEQPSET